VKAIAPDCALIASRYGASDAGDFARLPRPAALALIGADIDRRRAGSGLKLDEPGLAAA
jgi:hypothetical protein